MVSLMYPCVLIVLVILLMVFLVTYVVPTFATLYSSMQAKLAGHDGVADRHGHCRAQLHRVLRGGAGRRRFSCSAGGRAANAARERIDRVKMKMPVAGEIWLKYQVAQLSRILSTLLTGGIPLVQAMETAADSLNTPLLQRAVEGRRQERARRAAAFGLAEGLEDCFRAWRST